MARKKEATKVDVPTYGGPEKVVLFGWCMTGHHTGCVVEFTGHRCSCTCHGSVVSDA